MRLFHIALGDNILLKDFDIHDGGDMSISPIYIPFSINNEGLVIYDDKRECHGAYNKDSKVLSVNLKPHVEKPKIDGLVLFKGTIEGKITTSTPLRMFTDLKRNKF